jgi:hypothetical protein
MRINDERLEIAQDYAWNWFSYHAAQRMTVFRFFFLVMGVITVGYYQTFDDKPYIAMVLSVLAIFFCAAFYRLDQRTTELIKIGEALLKETESQFAKWGLKNTKLVARADTKEAPFVTAAFPRFFYSYGQVFPKIFLILGVFCLIAFACACQTAGLCKCGS